jgi:hypothetical protein
MLVVALGRFGDVSRDASVIGRVNKGVTWKSNACWLRRAIVEIDYGCCGRRGSIRRGY